MTRKVLESPSLYFIFGLRRKICFKIQREKADLAKCEMVMKLSSLISHVPLSMYYILHSSLVYKRRKSL